MLAKSVQVMEHRGVLSADLRRVMLSSQPTLRSEQAASLAQRNILTFFQ